MLNLKPISIFALFAMFLLPFSQNAFAQCEEGEAELTISVYTDAWGYETYWEIYEEGVGCGVDPIYAGGNVDQVGCDGGGQQDAGGGNGYDNFTQYNYGPACVTLGTPLEITYVDDWGDGGFTMEIFIDGQLIGWYQGGGSGNVWNFTPGESNIPPYDTPCFAEPVEVDGDPVSLNNEEAIASFNEVTPGGGNCALQGIWCEGGISNSIWASFEAPASGSVYITTCLEGTDFDTQIALWNGDCEDQSTFTLISANDDILGGCGPGNGFASGMYAGCLTEGETYYIQIDGWNGDTGTCFVSVTESEDEPVLTAFVNDLACPVDKGEAGTGSILPYFIGYGSDFVPSWAGPNGFTSDEWTIGDLGPGDYTLTATTACGEVFEQTWNVNIPAAFNATYSVTQPECSESGDGAIEVDLVGGTPPYIFTWEGSDEYTSDQLDIEFLNEGQYTLSIEDQNGCLYEGPLVNVEGANAIDLDLGEDQTLCLNEDLLLVAPPGYLYVWQDNSINQFYEVDAWELGEGEYSFICTAYSEDGCEAIDAITINVENCIGVDELEGVNPEFYPNPANAILNFKNIGERTLVMMFDAGGRKVKEETISGSANWDVSNFESGVYEVVFSVDGAVTRERLIIQ